MASLFRLLSHAYGNFAATWARDWRSLVAVMLVWVAVTTAVFFRSDARIVELAHHAAPPWLLTVCQWIRNYGDMMPVGLLGGLVTIAIGRLRRQEYWQKAGAALVLVALLTGVSVQLLKSAVGRPRPPMVQRGEAASHWQLVGPTRRQKWRSYPSGHSATAAAVTGSVAILVPGTWPLMMPLAVGVGVSRIYNNQHYPTDVCHGLALGWAMAWLGCSGLRRERELGR